MLYTSSRPYVTPSWILTQMTFPRKYAKKANCKRYLKHYINKNRAISLPLSRSRRTWPWTEEHTSKRRRRHRRCDTVTSHRQRRRPVRAQTCAVSRQGFRTYSLSVKRTRAIKHKARRLEFETRGGERGARCAQPTATAHRQRGAAARGGGRVLTPAPLVGCSCYPLRG
jgi:hypothetical protein